MLDDTYRCLSSNPAIHQNIMSVWSLSRVNITYRRPRQDMHFQIRIDAFDIIDDREQIRWCLVDIEVRERSVTFDIVEGVCYTKHNKIEICISGNNLFYYNDRYWPEAEKSEAPSGTRRYERPAPFLPSVATSSINMKYNHRPCVKLTIKELS